MTIVKSRPTSPGRRFRVKISNKDIYQGQPHQPLLVKLNKSGGRNNQGRITTRHIGGGHKRRYRLIDFKRNKDNIPATVERLSMTLTEMQILHFYCMQMVKGDT